MTDFDSHVDGDDGAAAMSEPWTVQYDSFEEFYTATYSMVLRVTALVLHDISMAEEATHDVFVEVLRGPSHFDPSRGTLRTWLLTVARRRAIDRVRSVRSARLNDDHFARLESDRVIESVEEAVHRGAEYQEVREVIEELPDGYREILELTYWKGFSRQEIADFYGIPLGTAKTRVRQALKTLRANLQEQA